MLPWACPFYTGSTTPYIVIWRVRTCCWRYRKVCAVILLELRARTHTHTHHTGTLRGKVADFGVSKFMPNNDKGEQDLVEVMQGSDSGDISAKFESEEDSIENGCPTPNSTMKATMTAGCGTPSHMAPEVWLSMQGSFKHKKVVKFSKKVDVYRLDLWCGKHLNWIFRGKTSSLPLRSRNWFVQVSVLKFPREVNVMTTHCVKYQLVSWTWWNDPECESSDRPDFGFLTNKFRLSTKPWCLDVRSV